MRMYADNGGVQQNQLLIPNLPRSNREAQCQTHPAQSVYTDISANNSAEEFNGNFTSIDTEVVRLLSIFSSRYMKSKYYKSSIIYVE